ncbi:hypothetical protein [Photobacterium leiognathi]|uniref:hypothetical protein n=1 Tax=Photobacterium leiognathi TaxID=553611 RepID=UPI002732BE8B|nr:hypothetical protein [Photobacterium leiognathi]
MLFKNDDEAIDENDVELDLLGTEVMYELTNLPNEEFHQQVKNIARESGFWCSTPSFVMGFLFTHHSLYTHT